MFPVLGAFGLGVAGLAALSGLAGIAYAAFVIWMIVDGVLRRDDEYPGLDPNRKVFWVVAMVLFHPVAIAYFIAVYSKCRRAANSRYTCCEQVPPQA